MERTLPVGADRFSRLVCMCVRLCVVCVCACVFLSSVCVCVPVLVCLVHRHLYFLSNLIRGVFLL